MRKREKEREREWLGVSDLVERAREMRGNERERERKRERKRE